MSYICGVSGIYIYINSKCLWGGKLTNTASFPSLAADNI